MVMIANYMMVDDETLKALEESENIFELIESLEHDGRPIYGMDRFWDGLHFWLTGASASTPIEGNHLSTAIAGLGTFDLDYDSEDFATYISVSELPQIIEALEAVDVAELTLLTQFSLFDENEIYPGNWSENSDDKANLITELLNALTGLIRFYKSAVEQRSNIVVTIY